MAGLQRPGIPQTRELKDEEITQILTFNEPGITQAQEETEARAAQTRQRGELRGRKKSPEPGLHRPGKDGITERKTKKKTEPGLHRPGNDGT